MARQDLPRETIQRRRTKAPALPVHAYRCLCPGSSYDTTIGVSNEKSTPVGASNADGSECDRAAPTVLSIPHDEIAVTSHSVLDLPDRAERWPRYDQCLGRPACYDHFEMSRPRLHDLHYAASSRSASTSALARSGLAPRHIVEAETPRPSRDITLQKPLPCPAGFSPGRARPSGSAGRQSRSARCCAIRRSRNSNGRRSASCLASPPALRRPYSARLVPRGSAASRAPATAAGRTTRPAARPVSTVPVAPRRRRSSPQASPTEDRSPPRYSPISRRLFRPALKCPPLGFRPASVAS
jgi:hypothetical protein